MNCCICGSSNDVRWCPWCGHAFCRTHRSGWGIWDRGYAAVREWLTGNPPRYCEHD